MRTPTLRARKLARRPIHATRAVAEHTPLEYTAATPAPRWLIVGTGVLGGLVAVELAFALAVIS